MAQTKYDFRCICTITVHFFRVLIPGVQKASRFPSLVEPTWHLCRRKPESVIVGAKVRYPQPGVFANHRLHLLRQRPDHGLLKYCYRRLLVKLKPFQQAENNISSVLRLKASTVGGYPKGAPFGTRLSQKVVCVIPARLG